MRHSNIVALRNLNKLFCPELNNWKAVSEGSPYENSVNDSYETDRGVGSSTGTDASSIPMTVLRSVEEGGREPGSEGWEEWGPGGAAMRS
jgi:hypothetical protein